MRYCCLYLTTIFAFAISFSFSQKKHVADKESLPNVIIIFMDDMGYGDAECYGGFPYHTPYINKLAAQGMRFTNFYAAQAVCSASRSALLTGCYPTRIGISGALNHQSKIALNPGEETIAELLKQKGYTTGIVGKWHLGCKEPYLPLQNGFDEYFGLPYSNDMWHFDFEGKAITDTANWKSNYPPLPLIEGNKMVREIKSLDDQGELTTLYTEHAVQFIRKNKEQPFFLYLAHNMPHVPLAVSSKFKNKSGAGLYGDVMEEIDWSVGEIMKTLDDLKLADNTLIILSSDNGPWITFGNHAGNTDGLHEGKGTVWDGGLKVPCIMRWPGKIKAGSIGNGLITTMDILPTLATICKTKPPSNKIDGLDMTDYITGKTAASPRDEFVYYYDKNNLKAIRKGNWKLTFAHVSQTRSHPENIGQDGFPGKYETDLVPLSLFNLITDPGEDRNVITRYPEVAEQLQMIAEKYRKALGDGLNNRVGDEVRPAARVE